MIDVKQQVKNLKTVVVPYKKIVADKTTNINKAIINKNIFLSLFKK